MDPKEAAAMVRKRLDMAEDMAKPEPIPDRNQARMSAASPGTALPADTPIMGQPLMGPAAGARMVGGAIKTMTNPRVLSGAAKVAEFAAENLPTVTNPLRPVRGVLRAGAKYLSERGAAAAKTAGVGAEASEPMVKLATQTLKDPKQIEIAARAAGASEAEVKRLVRQAMIDMLSSGWNK